MATIQVRNIPEDVHRVYQARAIAAGMSLQEYVLAELMRNARRRTPAELVREAADRMRTEGEHGWAHTPAARVLRTERDRH